MPSQLVWYARCPTLTAMGLLANRGALQREFLREPVNLVSVRENSTPSVRQGYLDHSLPNLVREGDAATALWSYGLNQRSRLLAVGHTWHTVLVIASGRSGIGKLSDLKGRTLALPREAGAFSPARVRSLRAWETILGTVGIKATDIEFHNIVADHPSTPFGDIARREIEAVLSGQADAGLLFGAKGLELARAAGVKVIHAFTPDAIRRDPALSGLVELRTLTVDYPFLEANEGVVARLVKQLTSATDWAVQFPKEALNHIALEGKVEVPDAAEAYGDLIPEGAALGEEDWRIDDLQALLDWLKARHAVEATVELRPWQRTDVLNKAPEAADIKEKYKRLNAVA
ncbi:ABC transporter substrate-binding protein [Asticcacaulis sp. YBE204]|uniref:ABC transporter substrate-binding protein n=1 Tax=Asticcacaulis sp. YBE204 TaxID=1282363 RepID=UPI00190FA065|nr:ABC transporter substrate-binding protein [Asticcacaulis sp. YBE204]